MQRTKKIAINSKVKWNEEESDKVSNVISIRKLTFVTLTDSVVVVTTKKGKGWNNNEAWKKMRLKGK